MINYIKQSTKHIQQLTQWRDSIWYLDLETTLNFDEFARESPKQMRNKLQEVGCNAQVRLDLLLMRENSKSHWWIKDEQLWFGASFNPICQNSWSRWWMELAARRISQIDQELREFRWILAFVFLREFDEFGGKRDCDFGNCEICYELVMIRNIYLSLIHT